MKRTRNPRDNKTKDFRKRGYDDRGYIFVRRADTAKARKTAAALALAEAAAYVASKAA